jgi:hypothetical protein
LSWYHSGVSRTTNNYQNIWERKISFLFIINMRIAIFHSFILIVIYLVYSDAAGNLNFKLPRHLSPIPPEVL